jgi:hypothetical protein
MNTVVWVLQVVLAALFAIAGGNEGHPAQGPSSPNGYLGLRTSHPPRCGSSGSWNYWARLA